MTIQGAEILRAELEKIMDVERPKVVELVSWAAGNGDRSENGDYIYGKKKLRELDGRIRYLNKRMDNLVAIDPSTIESETILFGATVVVMDEEETERRYQIVGVDEADASSGRISWISPIAKCLLQRRAGDVVNYKSPKGEVELEIMKVEYGSN